MERKIGEIFEFGGEWYQCVVAIQGCRECSFHTQDHCTRHFECLSELRRDKTSVVFKKLEKVGEPFTSVGKLYQHYKVFEIDNVCGDGFWCVHNYKAKTLTIEIKQTKQDMEEKKEITLDEMIQKCEELEFNSYYKQVKDWLIELKQCKEEKHSNSENIGKSLKPFNLETAKAGKPVITRDGRKARLIAVDLNNKTYPLAAVIENNGEENEVHNYTSDGLATYGTLNDADLMIITEKKEGWVNVYKECDGERVERFVYKTEKEAFDNAEPDNYIATVKIEWEE